MYVAFRIGNMWLTAIHACPVEGRFSFGQLRELGRVVSVDIRKSYDDDDDVDVTAAYIQG